MKAKQFLKLLEEKNNPNSYTKTIQKLAPVMFALAIAGTTLSVMEESLKGGLR